MTSVLYDINVDNLPTLAELQERNLARASISDIGMTITIKATEPDDIARAEAIIEMIDRYLAQFVPGTKCPKCECDLAGLLGTFVYGIPHAEGHCCKCGYPARALHYIKDSEGVEIFERALPIVLAYHPSELNGGPR